MQGLLFIAMLVLFAVIAYKLISRKLKLRGHEISSRDMLVRFDDGPYIVDVRTADEYRQGHIPGVNLVPLNDLGRRYKEIPQDREVYVICRSGSRSARRARRDSSSPPSTAEARIACTPTPGSSASHARRPTSASQRDSA